MTCDRVLREPCSGDNCEFCRHMPEDLPFSDLPQEPQQLDVHKDAKRLKDKLRGG